MIKTNTEGTIAIRIYSRDLKDMFKQFPPEADEHMNKYFQRLSKYLQKCKEV